MAARPSKRRAAAAASSEEEVDLVDVLDARVALASSAAALPKSTTRRTAAVSPPSSEGEGAPPPPLTQAQVASLLSLVEGLPADAPALGKKRRRLAEVGGGEEPVHGAGAGAGGATSLDLAALMAGFAGDEELAHVRKRLQRLAAGEAGAPRGAAPLPTPVSRPVQAKADRVAAYTASSKDASQWLPLIAANRRAPHLSFSAEALATAGGIKKPSIAALSEKFTPENPFEAAVASALAASGAAMGLGEGSARARATPDAPVHDDLPPAADGGDRDRSEKTSALAALRALMSYEGAVRRRQNKIKSKAYRRLKGRHDARVGAAEMETLRASDPAAVAALEAETAKRVAKERMTLKARTGHGIGGSKWIHRVLSRGGTGAGTSGDAVAKRELTNALSAAGALRARMAGDRRGSDDEEEAGSGSGSEQEDDEEELDDAKVLASARARVLGLVPPAEGEEEPAGPPAKGLLGMKFMQAAAAKSRAAAREGTLRVAAELGAAEAEVRAGGRAPVFDEVSLSSDAEVEEQEGEGGSDSGASSSASSAKVEAAPAAPGRRSFGGVGAKPLPPAKGGMKHTTKGTAPTTGAVQGLTVDLPGTAWTRQGGVTVAGLAGGAGAPSVVVTSAPAAPTENPWLTQLGDDPSVSKATSSRRAKAAAKAAAGTAGLDVQAALNALGAGQKAAPAGKPPAPTAEKSRLPDQAELVRLAFVGEGVTPAELEAERVEDAQAAEVATTAPTKKGARGGAPPPSSGWGSWAGLGAPTPAEQAAAAVAAAAAKRRYAPRPSKVAAAAAAAATAARPSAPKLGPGAQPSQQRADAGLERVLLSERRDRKLAAHQAPTFPRGFKSAALFEATLAAPLGREWNTAAVTAAATKPSVTTRAGLIVQPLRRTSVPGGRGGEAAVRAAGEVSAVAGGGRSKTRK